MNQPIRSQQRAMIRVVAWLAGPALMLGPPAGGIWLLVMIGPQFHCVCIVVVAAAVSVFCTHHMLQAFDWVEFDGCRIRGKTLWTRQLTEHSLNDVFEIRPLYAIIPSMETQITDRLLGRIRGYEICFCDGMSINLIKYDMTNVDELIEAITRAVRDPYSLAKVCTPR